VTFREPVGRIQQRARLTESCLFVSRPFRTSSGFRGASRYYDERYRQGFALECLALKRVREGMGLTNVKVMVPFCRTVEEARLVTAELARNGLTRHEQGLELYMMVEIPSNVILLRDFAE
jgi:pyruvate,water dikinase